MVSATATELAAAAVVLVATVAAGTAVHELSHALALRALHVPCSIEFLPTRERRGVLSATVTARWATVHPTGNLTGLSPWRLRAAALTPLSLVIPFTLIPLGLVPDPFAVGHPVAAAVAVGWAGCALPSPQDFALVWHPEETLSRYDDGRAIDRGAGDG